MATKKKAAPKTLQARINTIQNEAQKQIRAGFDRTVEMLPAEPRKAVKKLTADVEKASRDLGKRADSAVKDARKRAEKLANDVQKQIESVVKPVAERLEQFSLASRSDLNALRKRVDQLEKKIEAQASSARSHAATHA